jgi:hypothetical protein
VLAFAPWLYTICQAPAGEIVKVLLQAAGLGVRFLIAGEKALLRGAHVTAGLRAGSEV